MVKKKRLFIDISSPSTASIVSKKHWLLVVEDSTDYSLSYFSQEKFKVKDMMMSLLKELQAMYVITVRYNHGDNAGESEAFE